MADDTDKDDQWITWSKFVLKELERLNDNYDNLSKQFNEFYRNVLYREEFSKLKDELRKEQASQKILIDELRLKFAKWSGVALVVISTAQVALHFILKILK